MGGLAVVWVFGFLGVGLLFVIYVIAADKTRFLTRFDLDQWRDGYYLRSLPNFLQALHDNHFRTAWPSRCNAVSAAFFRFRTRPMLRRKPSKLRSAFLQQHIGEAAGRGADIEGDETGDIDGEVIERMRELDAAARDPGMIARFDLERRVIRVGGACFVELPIAAEDRAGENQRLCLGTRLGETTLDQQHIQTLLFDRHAALRSTASFSKFRSPMLSA